MLQEINSVIFCYIWTLLQHKPRCVRCILVVLWKQSLHSLVVKFCFMRNIHDIHSIKRLGKCWDQHKINLEAKTIAKTQITKKQVCKSHLSAFVKWAHLYPLGGSTTDEWVRAQELFTYLSLYIFPFTFTVLVLENLYMPYWETRKRVLKSHINGTKTMDISEPDQAFMGEFSLGA